MAVWGLDVEQVQQLASTLNSDASQIEQIISTLTSKVESTQWTGPDRDKFVNEWNSTYVPALRQVVQGLQQTATAANQNATQQQQASQS